MYDYFVFQSVFHDLLFFLFHLLLSLFSFLRFSLLFSSLFSCLVSSYMSLFLFSFFFSFLFSCLLLLFSFSFSFSLFRLLFSLSVFFLRVLVVCVCRRVSSCVCVCGVCGVVWCAVWCGTLKTPCVDSKTPPCVDSKRPRGASIHGDVLNLHTEAFLSLHTGGRRQFSLPKNHARRVITWPHRFTESNHWMLPMFKFEKRS